jgi:hypothetical protein
MHERDDTLRFGAGMRDLWARAREAGPSDIPPTFRWADDDACERGSPGRQFEAPFESIWDASAWTETGVRSERNRRFAAVLMELAGLEPATSWVRSTQSIQPEPHGRAICSPLDPVAPTPSPTLCGPFATRTTPSNSTATPRVCPHGCGRSGNTATLWMPGAGDCAVYAAATERLPSAGSAFRSRSTPGSACRSPANP